MDKSKWILTGVSGLVIAALAGGSLLFANISRASASSVKGAVGMSSPGLLEDGEELGRGGRRGGQSDALLAKALGISEEELRTAQENAFKAAVQQALDAGLITQAQADWLTGNTRLPRMGLGALMMGPDSGIDLNVLLAAELGISVEELQAARERAVEIGWEQALADGRISAEQVELIKARRALQGTVDYRALALEAVGLTQEQLDAYREDGLDRDAILEELGMTADEAKAAVQDAYKAAIAEAVKDSVITQAQADLLLEKLDDGFLRPGGRGRFPGGMMPGGMKPGGIGPDSGFDGAGPNDGFPGSGLHGGEPPVEGGGL